uniref:TFIIA_gamma_C domain-containing protein n=1 Tax=Panagrellus redivivus TaxID=6233 RepID=A0A7E4W5C7_PANRE
MAIFMYTTIGRALSETLNEASENGLITEKIAAHMRKAFEKAIWEGLKNKTKLKVTINSSRLVGCRHIEGQWTLIARNVNIKVGYKRPGNLEKLKIVAIPRVSTEEEVESAKAVTRKRVKMGASKHVGEDDSDEDDDEDLLNEHMLLDMLSCA